MPEEVQHRKGREGSRWINERPSGTDVAEWFKEAVSLPDGMDHGRYVNGVTLIPNKEKSQDVVGFRDNGAPIIENFENLVFTPYVKVETRIQYWHDLLAANASDWEGVIEKVSVKEQDPTLPPGFFFYIVRTGENQGTRFVCCCVKATIYKRGKRSIRQQLVNTVRGSEVHTIAEGETVLDAPAAVKMVAVRRGSQQYVDDNALMKAETGAIGRALGFAGMLIVPGSGVATAEDMSDAATQSSPTPENTPEAATIAAETTATLSDEDLQARAKSLIEQLQEDKPEKHREFLAWCKEREITKLSDLDAAALRGVIKKVEKSLDAEAAKA